MIKIFKKLNINLLVKGRKIIIWSLVLLGLYLYNTNIDLNKKISSVTAANTNNMVMKNSMVDDEVFETNLYTEILYNEDIKNIVEVETKLITANIDLKSGDISFIKLKNYLENNDSDNGIVVLNDNSGDFFSAHSNIGKVIKKNNKLFKEENNIFKLSGKKIDKSGNTKIELTAINNDGVVIKKSYTFFDNDYSVGFKTKISNLSNTDWFGNHFLTIAKSKKNSEGGGFFKGIPEGKYSIVISEDGNKFGKFEAKKIEKKEGIFNKVIKSGWAGISKHYFLVSWIPEQNLKFKSYYKGNNEFSKIILVSSNFLIEKGEDKSFSAKLYVGPKTEDNLLKAAPGLKKTIDYGIFWSLCSFFFYLLKTINTVIKNWGFSIALLTLFVKIVFYKFASISYKSMIKMKKIQPQLTEIKERYKDNRIELSRAMSALYKKEKINPMASLFPMLIQIPVFIALYSVISESIELRHAPFILWISDLSAKDPYYILPLLMGISMFIMQKISPQPNDNTQAKIMLLMPVILTVTLAQFPAGLVLYWVINNVLSILQQLIVMRKYNK